MGKYGGTSYGRYSQREVRQRRTRLVSYVFLAALAVATVGVVLAALGS